MIICQEICWWENWGENSLQTIISSIVFSSTRLVQTCKLLVLLRFYCLHSEISYFLHKINIFVSKIRNRNSWSYLLYFEALNTKISFSFVHIFLHINIFYFFLFSVLGNHFRWTRYWPHWNLQWRLWSPTWTHQCLL